MFCYQGCHQIAVKAILIPTLQYGVTLFYTNASCLQMLSKWDFPCCKETFTKNNLGKDGFYLVHRLQDFLEGRLGRNSRQEPRGGPMQRGGALRAGLLPWIAQLPFLYCKVAPTVVCTLNEQSRKHSHRTCTEQSDGAVPVLRFPFPRCVKVPTEAKCAGCRVKDPRA